MPPFIFSPWWISVNYYTCSAFKSLDKENRVPVWFGLETVL